MTLAMIPAHGPLAKRNQPIISIKLAKLKSFNGNTTHAPVWLSTIKCYYIVVGITYIASSTANTEAAYQYAVALIGGNAARWMDKLKVQGNAPNSFLEFDKVFIY